MKNQQLTQTTVADNDSHYHKVASMCSATRSAILVALFVGVSVRGSSAREEERPAKDEQPGLFFREDWQETPEELPVTQEHLNNDALILNRHGPAADAIKKSHHDDIRNDPWYVWSGMCRRGRWAISLRRKNAVVDLSKAGRIRWRTRQSGAHVLKLILELEDGTWLVSDQGFGETPDWQVFTLDLDLLERKGYGIKWHKLDIETIDAGKRVLRPDLSRVRSVGWTDLMVGEVSKGCTRVDWIEVQGKTVQR